MLWIPQDEENTSPSQFFSISIWLHDVYSKGKMFYIRSGFCMLQMWWLDQPFKSSELNTMFMLWYCALSHLDQPSKDG